MRPRNGLIFTFGCVEMERIVFGNKPPTVLSHVHRLCWLGTNWRGLSWGCRRASLMNISFELIWKRIHSFGFASQWWRLFRYSSVMWLNNTVSGQDSELQNMYSLSLSVPLAWLLIYSAESEWSLIWIFLSGIQQIFSHDTKIFRDHKCIIASFNGLRGL